MSIQRAIITWRVLEVFELCLSSCSVYAEEGSCQPVFVQSEPPTMGTMGPLASGSVKQGHTKKRKREVYHGIRQEALGWFLFAVKLEF